jgi:hypothetical protein
VCQCRASCRHRSPLCVRGGGGGVPHGGWLTVWWVRRWSRSNHLCPCGLFVRSSGCIEHHLPIHNGLRWLYWSVVRICSSLWCRPPYLFSLSCLWLYRLEGRLSLPARRRFGGYCTHVPCRGNIALLWAEVNVVVGLCGFWSCNPG